MICKDLQLWKRYPSQQFRTGDLSSSLIFFPSCEIVKPSTFKIANPLKWRKLQVWGQVLPVLLGFFIPKHLAAWGKLGSMTPPPTDSKRRASNASVGSVGSVQLRRHSETTETLNTSPRDPDSISDRWGGAGLRGSKVLWYQFLRLVSESLLGEISAVQLSFFWFERWFERRCFVERDDIEKGFWKPQ